METYVSSMSCETFKWQQICPGHLHIHSNEQDSMFPSPSSSAQTLHGGPAVFMSSAPIAPPPIDLMCIRSILNNQSQDLKFYELDFITVGHI